MFHKRSDKPELMDDLSLNDDELRKNLDELEIINRLLGSEKLLINSLNKIHERYTKNFNNHKIVIADLCCGGGDLLRTVDCWAKSKNLPVELIGIDANPFMIEYALQKSSSANITYKVINIFSPEFSQMQFEVICINSACHHFSDATLVQLFKQLAKQTKLAIIVNDLQRHWVSYYAIKVAAQLFKFSHYAKHDAPLSVLRAFSRRELVKIFELSKLKSYEIRWRWAFRWEGVIWLL